ncbi:cartilage intermediate layer protein 2-like [Mugil cephalus]|uniref:cartilage intermediate layer protein 2-like n=1 Tax=Mugil cephalus TaxID=48193 RepID=UPI001FB7E766|nr:cartilage intermediate layer protein 2-like [Mugil cephalus]
MIRLLCVAVVVAGLVSESNQMTLNVSNAVEPGNNDRAALFSLKEVKPADEKVWPSSSIQCWTDWFDRDNPSGTGDWESLYNLRKENPGKICPKPVNIEARTLSGLSVAAAGDVIYKSDTTSGFICRNMDQSKKMCNDYRVRFSCHPPFCGGVCWTKWYDRDNPSGTGDWELLSNLKTENPGQICGSPLFIEAVTTDTLTPAIYTGENLFVYNPTQGFVCRKMDQKSKTCRDYKVRFGCPCY